MSGAAGVMFRDDECGVSKRDKMGCGALIGSTHNGDHQTDKGIQGAQNDADDGHNGGALKSSHNIYKW